MKHLIILHSDERGSWRFEYHGKFRWWQKLLVRLAGWEVRPIKHP